MHCVPLQIPVLSQSSNIRPALYPRLGNCLSACACPPAQSLYMTRLASCGSRLPIELIQIIIDATLATDTSYKPLLSFIQVSKDWHFWIEPKLYRTVLLTTERQLQLFLCTLETRSASISKHVQHITLSISCPRSKTPTSAAIGGVLAACYALESLTLHPSVLPYAIGLPDDVTLSCVPLYFPSAFNSVKHLRLQVSPYLFSTIFDIVSLQALTHVAIDFPCERAKERSFLLAFCAMIINLLKSDSVQVIAILVNRTGVRKALDRVLANQSDERVIAVELSGQKASDVKAGKRSVWTVIDEAIHEDEI
jgi:hypothetical protein